MPYLNDILRIIGTHLDLSIHRVFVFGSHIAGTAHTGSDIDIGIEGPKEIPFEIMGAIKEGVAQLPTLRSFDIVDFTMVSHEFRAIAEKHAILLQ